MKYDNATMRETVFCWVLLIEREVGCNELHFNARDVRSWLRYSGKEYSRQWVHTELSSMVTDGCLEGVEDPRYKNGSRVYRMTEHGRKRAQASEDWVENGVPF